MGLNIDTNNLKINQAGGAQDRSVANTGTSTSGNVSIFQNNDEAVKQLCNKLQISKEQLGILLGLYPDFYTLDPAKQAEIVKNNITSLSVNNETDKDVNITNTTDKPNSSDAGTVDNPEINEQPAFNHKEFSNLSVQEKVNVYALELAKNKFLYQGDNKKSIEEWNSLSEEERNSLVKNEFDTLTKDKSKDLYDEKDINFYFNSKMTKLQTANYLTENIDDFNKSEGKRIASSIHDYLFSQDKKNLSKAQNVYIEDQYVLSKAVVQACKDKGDTTYVDGVDYNLAEDEIAAKFGKDGILNGTNKFEVQMKYLQDKLNKGIQLDEIEQAQYKRLNTFFNSHEGKLILDALKEDNNLSPEVADKFKGSQYYKDYQSALEPEQRLLILKQYFKTNPSLSKREQINLTTYCLRSGDLNIDKTFKLTQDVIENASNDEQNDLVTNTPDKLGNVLISSNVNRLCGDAAQKLVGKQVKMARNGDTFSEKLAELTISISDDEHYNDINEICSGSGNKNIEKANVARAYSVDTSSERGRLIQKDALESVNENSSLETRKYAACMLDEAHKDNQIPLTELFSQDKEVAKAMNQDGTIIRYDKDNIATASHMLRTRFEQDDFSKDEAVNQLNILADNIKDVKYADVQLEMHNDIMQSKYSEVQEHAAGNIKDYDPTVQTKALETVLASGNEKAIEAAAESVKYSPDCVKSEMAEVIEAYASDNAIQADSAILEQFADLLPLQAKTIQEKIASGQILSENELSTLSVTERRNYFASFFKKLPVDKKIKLLASMPDSQKKTVYTLIARTDSALFNAIIKDKDRADQLLSMGLPEDVNNKIKGVVSFLAVSDIGYQNIAAKYDIAYDNNDEVAEKDKKYATKPEDFDTKEIYKKDKKGNILA